ncbi:MAG: 1-deoxy-D-xylulose-5-phosphate reductoisomerase [Luminiphilus sp.]|nr:1-deoxy-D-xylulose-5-phosphate reductoisomerase [Luminiphilus sp.]
MQNIMVLGATGSIGLSTLDVIARHPRQYRAYALAANRSVESMVELCMEHKPAHAVMFDADAASELERRLAGNVDTTVHAGETPMIELAESKSVDTVMAAIVGFAGLSAALAAARAGKRLLLANKEALVSAGSIFMNAVREGGALLLPVDSEHNAMFQCLPADEQARPQMDRVEKILLTASGGPFRGKSRSELIGVTPDQACAHPNWSMGRKISVDSATLVNKGLELAEACWLFNQKPSEIEVVVHPQSIVHSLIRYVDGSVVAQLGQPDMRTPIAYSLSWPDRIEAGVDVLDLVTVGRLDFEAPNLSAFPCLQLAYEAIDMPGGMCAFSAANEVAVEAFLSERIRFTDIDRVIEHTLKTVHLAEPSNLVEVQDLDSSAREVAGVCVAELAC